jgi:molybdate transport system substrate-binding protein
VRPLALLFASALLLPPPPAPLTVSAATSLTDVMEALAPMHVRSGGAPVRFNFGPSNALARQIARGAPVDLFVSADESQMEVAAAAGAIDPGSRVNLLSNRLAIVTGRVTPVRLSSLDALAGAGVRRIAIGDPAAVPAGVYARQYLQARGLWDTLRPRLVPVSNVRAAIAAVENGSVEAAIVYESDTVRSRVDVAFVVSGVDAPRILYPAAVVKSSRRRDEAVAFLKFLCGAEAATIFTSFKFVPLGCMGAKR